MMNLQLSKKDKIGLALGLVVVPVAIAAYFLLNPEPEPIDKVGCPLDRRVGHTLILIDKTDQFTIQQKRILEHLLEAFKEDITSLDIFEKLSIYVFNDSNYIRPKPKFSGCRPQAALETSEFSDNPLFRKEQFDKKFKIPLTQTIDELMVGGRSDQTPLLEMLREISILSDFQDDYPRRHLIIFSDLLQNTNGFSMYGIGGERGGRKDKLSYDEIKQQFSSFFELVKPQFQTGLIVSLYILQRRSQRRAPPWDVVREFWRAYFADQGIVLKTDVTCRDNLAESCVYIEP